MSQALSEFRSPVGQEALRLRMVAMHGREDALLDAGRFPRLLRQANDAEVADVRKVGDDDYEISAQGGSTRAALLPAAPAEELQPAAPTSDTTQDASPPGQRDNGQRFGVRFRRGSRAPSRGGEIPLIGVVRIEPNDRRIRFAGVGNISGFIRWRDGQSRTVSQNGVVGHNVSKVKEYEYVYGGDLLAVFHSDGLSTKWDIDSYPGLATRHPTMIAAVLYRDFKRVRDDNLIVVVKTSEA